MAAVDSLKTQKTETVYVGMDGQIATGTFQWLLDKSLTNPPTTGNQLTTFIGGKNGFEQIAIDIAGAKESIDLVCWGFDPGMALVRNECMKDFPWANGEPYGELIKRMARQGVRVRLLVWYSARGSAKQNSLIGYVEPGAYKTGATIAATWDEAHTGRGAKSSPKPLSAIRQDYCTQWWREATSGQISNLEVRCRDGVEAKVRASVAGEADQPSTTGGKAGPFLDESDLILKWATHHQKPILIDYSFADPKDKSKGPGHKAVGFVMGLNSLTDYWDDAHHPLDSKVREVDLEGASDDLSIAAIRKGKPISRKPLRDYACRVEGSALVGVYQNFCNAWNRAALLPKLSSASNGNSSATRTANLPVNLVPASLAKQDASGKADLPLKLQVLRTQPEETYKDAEQTWAFDKSIKHAYFQASSMARSYLYLENQYFFYEEWARHIKANRTAFMEWIQNAGKKSKDARLLHLFVVIPAPEDSGMIPRTYDTLRSLGQADSMPDQDKLVTDHGNDSWLAKKASPSTTDITASAHAVRTPSLDEQSVLLQDGKSLGIKVLVAKLVTSGPVGGSPQRAYRDIYIHSKLMLADDCFMTLGSANMNQRSMAADSEINIATDNVPHNRDLRQRVWKQLTGDAYSGGDGSQKEVEETFANWKKLAAKNKEALDKPAAKLPFSGFIVEFSDSRDSTERVG